MDPVHQRAQTFYSIIRDWIVWIVLFGLLYASSHLSLTRLLKKWKRENAAESLAVVSIPFVLCTFSGALALGLHLLVPATLWAKFALTLWPNSYYTQWLSPELIEGAWSFMYAGSHIALIILLPFAYFYHESDAVISPTGTWKRMAEAGVTLGLVVLLVTGLFSVFGAIIWAGDISQLLSLAGALDIASLFVKLTTGLGGLVIAVTAPEGMLTLINTSQYTSNERVKELKEAARLEEEAQAMTSGKLRHRRRPMAETVTFTAESPPSLAQNGLKYVSLAVNGAFSGWLLFCVLWMVMFGPSDSSPESVWYVLVESSSSIHVALATIVGTFSHFTLDAQQDPVGALVQRTATALIIGIAMPCVTYYLGISSVSQHDMGIEVNPRLFALLFVVSLAVNFRRMRVGMSHK